MMNQPIFTIASIVKFLANEATAEERKAIFDHIQNDQSNQQKFDSYSTLWALVENTEFSNGFSADKITEELKKLIWKNE